MLLVKHTVCVTLAMLFESANAMGHYHCSMMTVKSFVFYRFHSLRKLDYSNFAPDLAILIRPLGRFTSLIAMLFCPSSFFRIFIFFLFLHLWEQVRAVAKHGPDPVDWLRAAAFRTMPRISSKCWPSLPWASWFEEEGWQTRLDNRHPCPQSCEIW